MNEQVNEPEDSGPAETAEWELGFWDALFMPRAPRPLWVASDVVERRRERRVANEALRLWSGNALVGGMSSSGKAVTAQMMWAESAAQGVAVPPVEGEAA